MSQAELQSRTIEGEVAGNRLSGGLRRNALGVFGAVALAMAFTGPAGSIYYGEAAAAGRAGRAFAFSFILAALGVLLVAHSIAQFSRKLETSGLAFTYVSRTFGVRPGAYVGWLLMLGYVPIPTLLLAAEGALGHTLFKTYVGVNVPWYVFSVGLGVIGIAIVNSGVRRSVKTTLLFLAWEIAVTTALFITIMVRGGAHGNTIQPLNPAGAPSLSGLTYGLLWGFVMFFGFESAGTLGIETSNSRRNVPRALFVAVAIMSAYYLLSAYAATIGVGMTHVSKFVTDGWSGLARTYWGSGIGWLLDVTVMNSFFAIILSSLNASSRVLFAMGRGGVLPARLGHVNPKTGTPTAAGYTLIAAVLAMLIATGFAWGPLNSWYFFSVLTAIALLLVYMAIHVSLPYFYRRNYPQEFSRWKHLILPIVGALIVLLPLYGVIWPISPYPLDIVPWLALAWLVIGIFFARYVEARKPELTTVMQTVFEE